MDPRQSYNQRWMFFYRLSGIAMNIYNTIHFGMGTAIYAKYFIYLAEKAGYGIQLNAQMPLYWNDEQLPTTCDIHLLVNSNIIVDIYSKDADTNQHDREYLKNRMAITHCPYGMIINFKREILYSEWFARDPETGIIDKIKML